MLLKGGWVLANFLAFFARVIQRLLGLTVHHPGTMFGNTVFNIVSLSSGAIVAIFAFVGPLFLMLAFHMLFKGSSGTETLPSTRWPFTSYGLSFLVNFPQMACQIRLSWLHNTTVVTHIFFWTSPSNWWFLCRLICVRKGKRVCRCGGRVQRWMSIRRRNLLSTWLKDRTPVQRSSFIPRSNSLQV